MNTLTNLISQALIAGDEQRPTALLRAVEDLKTPHEVLTSLEPPHEPFDALEADAPGYGKLRYAPEAITDTEHSGLVRLLRWAVRELSEWSATADTKGTVLDSMFLVFQTLGFREAQWNLLPIDRTANIEIRDRFVQLLSNTSITMSAGPGRRQAHEQSIVDKVRHADEQQNWVELEGNWRFIADFLHGSLLLSQGVLYLGCRYPNALRNVVDHLSQMSVAGLVAKQLPLQLRFRLARESTSQRFQFAALLSVDWSDLENRQLPETASEDLTQLLVQAAQNPPQWRVWMKVFNEHPTRFPWLQISLGRALAQMPEAALMDYADAVSLYPWPFVSSVPTTSNQADSRSCVGACLQQFRANASESHRKALWARAHERWLAWSFGGEDQTLMGVCCSELDYALVGHAKETLSPDERLARIEANLSRVANLEGEWHSSFTSLLNVRNRLISQIQPLLVAQQPLENAWLSANTCWPQGYAESAYSRQRFSA